MTTQQLALSFILLAPVEWLIVLFAYRLARPVGEHSLSFSVGVFVACAVIVTIGAVLGFAYLNDFLPPGAVVVGFTSIIWIAGVVPPVWLVLYKLGMFR